MTTTMKMERWASSPVPGRQIRLACVLLIISLAIACNKSTPTPAQAPANPPSAIKVETKSGAPVVITTSTAEFQISLSGAVQAYLLKDGAKLSLDASSPEANYLVQSGKEVHFDFGLDQAKVSEASGKLGRGMRVEIPARPQESEGSNIQLTLAVE